jgi:uncharacterized membrane protein
MEAWLAPFHPQIVHAPIVLIVVGLLFELIGRALSLDWWRKAAFAMLIVGVLGAAAAVISGEGTSEVVEKQGVPEQTVDAHGDLAKIALWLGIAAVLARAIAGRAGAARGAIGALALVLHIAAAGTVAVAAHRGGQLVFEHGARVRVNGQPVVTGKAGAARSEGGEPGEAAERSGAGEHHGGGDRD